MFDGSFRTNFEKLVSPIGGTLHRIGVSPDLVTGLGVAMAAGCAVAIGTGHFRLAFVLLVMTGLPDALDGAVAKAGGTSGPRGAYFDSVSDRLSDGLLFAGAAWYLAGGGGGYDPRMALLPFGLYIAASLVSYQRAKAESLGFDARGGLMERAERFVVLGLGLLFAEVFVPVLWLMFVLTLATAAFRFVKVWKQASVDRPLPSRSPSANRRRQARAARRTRRSPVRNRRRS